MKKEKFICALALIISSISCSVKEDIEKQTISAGVIIQSGDNLNEQGFIKPELNSPTTKQFLANIKSSKLKMMVIDTSGNTSIQPIDIMEDGSFKNIDMQFTLHSLKTPNVVVYQGCSLLNHKTGYQVQDGYFGFELKDSTLYLFKVINEYTHEKPSNDNSELWNQYHQKLYSFNNINWNNSVMVTSSYISMDGINQYVGSVNYNDLISVNNDNNITAFSIKDNGNFIYRNTEYILYYVINDTTSKYTDGSILGVRDNVFGKISSETDMIVEEIAVKRSDVNIISKYASLVQDFIYVHENNLQILTLETSGDFTYQNKEYKLYYMLNSTTAKYIDGSIFEIRENTFVKIDSKTGTTIEELAMKRSDSDMILEYASLIQDFIYLDDNNNLTTLSLKSNGNFTYRNNDYNLYYLVDNYTAKYIDGSTFGLRDNVFGKISSETDMIVEEIAVKYDIDDHQK